MKQIFLKLTDIHLIITFGVIIWNYCWRILSKWLTRRMKNKLPNYKIEWLQFTKLPSMVYAKKLDQRREENWTY